MTVIVFHPNKKLASLFASNIHLYTNINATPFSDLTKAFSKLKTDPGIKNLVTIFRKDFFETTLFQENKTSLVKLNKIFLLQDVSIFPTAQLPLKNIFALNKEKVENNPNIILKRLLKSIATDYQITPKKMINIEINEYIPLGKELLMDEDIYPIDLFLKTSNCKFKPLCLSGEKLKIHKLKEAEFYVKSDERIKFIEHATSCIINELSVSGKDLESELGTIEQGYNLLNLLRDFNLTKDSKDLTEKMVGSIMNNLREDQNLKKVMSTLLKSKSSYRYVKDMLTLYAGCQVIDLAEWGDKDMREKYSFLALFSDISLTEDDHARYNSNEQIQNSCLVPEEKRFIKNHANESAEIIAKYDFFPFGLEGLVRGHHGNPQGSNFDANIPALTPINLIYMMCEDFSREVILLNDQQEEIQKEEILKTIKNKYKDHSKFSKFFNALEKL